MANLIADSPFLWGFLGAVLYGAPRLSACIFTARQAGTGWGVCLFDFVVVCASGLIAAGAVVPYIEASVFKSSDQSQMRAMATMVGLICNPIMPAVIRRLNALVLQRLPEAKEK